MRKSMMMTLSAAALLATAGCVSKSQYEELQGTQIACEEAKAKSDAAVISWEQRFDREAKRWTEMEKSVTTAMPQALSEFQAERERIVKMVPDQIKSDLKRYLDDYARTVAKGFEQLRTDNAEVKLQLAATQKALEIVGQDTRTIGDNTQSIGRMIDESLSGERGKRERLATDLTDIVNRIVEFDQTKVACKGCKDRLKMRDKTQEELLAFHQELMQDLATIQNSAMVPAAPEGVATTAAVSTSGAP